MRILWLTDYEVDLPKSGLEIPVYYLSKYLTGMNHQVEIVNLSKSKNFDEFHLKEDYDVFIIDFQTTLSSWKYLKSLNNKVKKIRFQRDSLLLNGLSVLLFSIKKDLKNIPKGFELFFKNFLKDFFVSIWKFDAYIFVNERDRNFFEKIFPWTYGKSFVVKNGVENNRFILRKKRSKVKEIIFVGPYEYYPNFLAGKYIVEKIAPKINNNEFLFRIVGKGWKEFSEKFKSPKNVVFEGFVEDISSIYQNAWIFIAPLFVGSGIKNKVLEAMSSGLPIVGTREAFSGIDISNFIISKLVCKTSDDFIKTIKKLNEDEEYYNRVSNESRLLVEKEFSWEISAKKFEKILVRIVEGEK